MGATARTVDLTNVKESSGFNQNRIPAGDYAAIITRVEDAVTKADQTPSYVFAIKIKDRPSSVFRYYCKLQENQLWKLRNIFIAAGKTVPKKKVRIDPNTIVGKMIGVTVEDAEDYNDREQSEIAGVFPASELDESINVATDVDEDDEPAEDIDLDEEPEEEPEADEAEDEGEAEEADPLAGLTRNEIKAEIKKYQADFQAKKSQSDDDLREILRGLQESQNDEEDEEEEAPAPKQRASRKSKPKIESDEDLDDIDIDDL